VTKQPDEQLLYCEICRSIVSADSKHCLACARCVNGFDHHCKWINNCIGRANYRWFLAMCSSALVMMSCYLANAVLLFSDEKAPQSARICFWVLGGLVLALAVLDFNLLAFHAYLMARGITTYQWILMDSTKEEERVVPKQEQPGDDTMHSVDS
jgi:palmitoyltransferase ZDHHC1/11